jgi:hypothetical protein
MEIGCEDGRFMELAQIVWNGELLLVVLNRCVLLPES